MKKKKAKFKKPNTGLKALQKIDRIGYAGVRVHKGFVHDSLRHTVLTCTLISDTDKKIIDATLKSLNTGPEVALLPDGQNGWSVVELTTVEWNGQARRCYLVKYKGMEVSLYFKRQLTEIKLNPGDPYPESVMQDPSEAWQKLDLLGRSAKQSNIVLSNVHKRLEEENLVLKQQVKTLSDLNSQIESEATKVTEQLSWFTPAQVRDADRRRRKDNKRQAKILARKKAKIAAELEKAKKKKKRKRRKS